MEDNPLSVRLEALRSLKRRLEDPIWDPEEYVLKYFGICYEEMRVTFFRWIFIEDDEGRKQPEPSDYHWQPSKDYQALSPPPEMQSTPFLTCNLCATRVENTAWDELREGEQTVEGFVGWYGSNEATVDDQERLTAREEDILRIKGVKCGLLLSPQSVLTIDRERLPAHILEEFDELNSRSYQRRIFLDEVVVPARDRLDKMRSMLDWLLGNVEHLRDTGYLDQLRSHPMLRQFIPSDEGIEDRVSEVREQLDYISDSAMPQVKEMIEDLQEPNRSEGQ